MEKLVQFTGLPYGDAVMLVEEVTSLLRGSTWHQFVECGNGNDSPVPGDSPDTGYEYQSSNNQVAVSVPVPEKAPSEGSNYCREAIPQSKSKVETNSKLK